MIANCIDSRNLIAKISPGITLDTTSRVGVESKSVHTPARAQVSANEVSRRSSLRRQAWLDRGPSNKALQRLAIGGSHQGRSFTMRCVRWGKGLKWSVSAAALALAFLDGCTNSGGAVRTIHDGDFLEKDLKPGEAHNY